MASLIAVVGFIVSSGHQQASATLFYPWNREHPSKLLHCFSLWSPETTETEFFLKKWQVSALWQGKFKSITANILRRKQSSPGLSLQYKRSFHLVSLCSGSLVPSCWMGGRGMCTILKDSNAKSVSTMGRTSPSSCFFPSSLGSSLLFATCEESSQARLHASLSVCLFFFPICSLPLLMVSSPLPCPTVMCLF